MLKLANYRLVELIIFMAINTEQIDENLSRSQHYFLREKEIIDGLVDQDQAPYLVKTKLGDYLVWLTDIGDIRLYTFKYDNSEVAGAPRSHAVSVFDRQRGSYDHFWLASNADPDYALVRFTVDSEVEDFSNPFVVWNNLQLRSISPLVDEKDRYEFKPTPQKDIDDLNEALALI